MLIDREVLCQVPDLTWIIKTKFEQKSKESIEPNIRVIGRTDKNSGSQFLGVKSKQILLNSIKKSPYTSRPLIGVVQKQKLDLA